LPDEVIGLLAPLPPWFLLATLLGLINAAACFLLLGRQIRHLSWYAGIGILAAAVGQVFSLAIQAPEPIRIGELNVLSASASTWLVLIAARIGGL
jgi:hypothetical protein